MSYCSCFIYFFFSFLFSRVLSARCVHASPRFSFAASPSSRLSPVFTYHYSTDTLIPVPKSAFRFLRAPNICIFQVFFYYVTPSQYYSTGCPAHINLPPTIYHPPVFTIKRYRTGIWIPVKNISICISSATMRYWERK